MGKGLVRSLMVCLLLCSELVRSELKCKMRYDIRSYMTWFDFGTNFIYGLYSDPPDSIDACPRCQNFGNVISELHYTVVDLEDNRQFWVNKENITALKFFQMLTRLMQVQVLFVNFFSVLQNLFKDPVLSALGAAKFTGFPAEEVIEFEAAKVSASVFSMYTMADTLPGADCKQFGYRLGSLLRMSTGTVLPTAA